MFLNSDIIEIVILYNLLCSDYYKLIYIINDFFCFLFNINWFLLNNFRDLYK